MRRIAKDAFGRSMRMFAPGIQCPIKRDGTAGAVNGFDGFDGAKGFI